MVCLTQKELDKVLQKEYNNPFGDRKISGFYDFKTNTIYVRWDYRLDRFKETKPDFEVLGHEIWETLNFGFHER